jgi:hypothetical protein
MNTLSSDRLERRRAQLLLRSAQLRNDLAQHVQVLRKPLGWVDQTRAAGDWLRRNPQWPLGALAVVALLRPRRALRWAGTAWWGFSLFQRARRLLAGI